MLIDNVLASVAVKRLDISKEWYSKVLGSHGHQPMPEVVEWQFPRGGALQVYEAPQRAGGGSCTLAVSDIEAVIKQLNDLGIDTSERSTSPRVKTVMVTDPDGNHLAFAQAIDAQLAK